jgi:hypothetical protein
MTLATGRKTQIEAEALALFKRNTAPPEMKVCGACRRRFSTRHPESRWCGTCRDMERAKMAIADARLNATPMEARING